MAQRKIKTVLLVPDSIRKPSGLKNDGSPNAHWRKFSERLKNFDSVPLAEWSEEEILGYLLKRYEDCFGLNWSLSFTGPPTKSPEMYIVRRMMTAIGTQKAWIAKQYIDWVFDKEIIPKKKQISSLAYFFNHGLCNHFRAAFQKNNKITRTTELPPDYISIASSLELCISTYGDLAFAKMAMDNQPGNENLAVYSKLFLALENIGFNNEILAGLE